MGELMRTWCYHLARHAHIRHVKRRKRPVVQLDDGLDEIVAAVRTISADVRLTLARQLAQIGRDPARVRTLANAAKDVLVALDPVGNAQQIREAEALAGNRAR
jgi:DNA-directed RNA polymerase specialized sigma24 family protein